MKNADPRFPATVFYAFKATESNRDGVTSTGWRLFSEGSSTLAMRSTRRGPSVRNVRTDRTPLRRTRWHRRSCLLVGAFNHGLHGDPGEFMAALRREMAPSVRLLQAENIAPVDMAQSAMGPGIAIFRYAKVVEADGTPMSRSHLRLASSTRPSQRY